MYFILAGEGASDLGTKDNGQIHKGAMTHIIDSIALVNYQALPLYEMLSEGEVKRLIKNDRRNTMPQGKEHKPHENTFLRAKYLGTYANGYEDGEYGVVYFKDSDGTRSAPKELWKKIVKAMQAGFNASKNKNCVPMVPRPKSEAWLMGYYQKNLPGQAVYNDCGRFEDCSGNDSSPNALKKQLRTALNTTGDVYDLITENEIYSIDWPKIDMPSFNLFRKRLENVLAAMNGRPYPHDVSYTVLA